MTQDPFGNLREWGSVLELLADLKSAGCLAECQRGIIRILRYRENWRLREEMLKQLGHIETPTEELIDEVCNIVMDENSYYEVRILASRALALLVSNQHKLSGTRCRPKMESIMESLKAAMATPHPPVFRDALGHCLQLLGL